MFKLDDLIRNLKIKNITIYSIKVELLKIIQTLNVMFRKELLPQIIKLNIEIKKYKRKIESKKIDNIGKNRYNELIEQNKYKILNLQIPYAQCRAITY